MCRKLTFLLLAVGAIALIAATASAATYDIRIATAADDTEERVPDGSMDAGSSDLEIPYENAGTPPTNPQLVGLRFALPIAKGATVTKAYVELECDETKGGTLPVNLIIEGQLTPNAPAFTSAAKNLSSRTRTAAKVKWAFANWTAAHQKAQSADISSIITELIGQDGWASGNAIVLILSDDPNNPSTGVRGAEAYEGEVEGAPLLHIEAVIPVATQPNPADGATGVLMPLLTWTAGDGAVAHNVYVGTSAELTAADLVGPALPVATYFYVPGLQPGVTYYWRVDEIDATGKITPGNVWRFTAEPIVAWAPDPANGAKGLFPSQTLKWSPGTAAVQHQVFLSTKRAEVLNGDAAADKGKIAETKLATGLLASGTTYYWRVDEIAADGKVNQGSVWSFTTAEAVANKIVAQWWFDLSSVSIGAVTGDPRYPNSPTGTELMDQFKGPFTNSDYANYGVRVYGWLTPPESGDYTFWIAANDMGELWLSTDADPANAKLIASVPSGAGGDPCQWDGDPAQKSVAIALLTGQKYFIMGLMADSGGRDHISAAWQGPGIADRVILSAQYVDTFALPPIEQPSYTFNGDLAASGADETTEAGTSLDGTWSHNNGSDAWDGTAPGAGAPGGVGALVEDSVTFLRIQDTGNPAKHGQAEPSNRKLYFQHPITVGLDGAHLEVRLRVAMTGVLDPVNPDSSDPVVPWPAGGVGYHIRDDGKGMFGIAQAGLGIVSFSLAKAGEIAGLATDALVMNNLVGTTASADVDTGVATAVANMMAITDATQWNTIVIDIAVGGKGTHVVTVSVNGEAAQSFDVTAGVGTNGTVNYITLGSSGTTPYTAFDVDYFRINE